MKIDYFKDIETDAVYACVGPIGLNALFRLKDPLVSATGWEFLTPGSPTWDEVHQRIYRNSRVEQVNPDEFPARLPPLPEVPNGPFPEWREYFLPEQPINASQYPSVSRFLKARNDEMVRVFIVLYEDTYETSLGDGEFHYFRDVFLTRKDAQRYIDDNRREGERFHLRTISIKLDHEVFFFPDFWPESYDRYKAEDVLTALEAHFRG